MNRNDDTASENIRIAAVDDEKDPFLNNDNDMKIKKSSRSHRDKKKRKQQRKAKQSESPNAFDEQLEPKEITVIHPVKSKQERTRGKNVPVSPKRTRTSKKKKKRSHSHRQEEEVEEDYGYDEDYDYEDLFPVPLEWEKVPTNFKPSKPPRRIPVHVPVQKERENNNVHHHHHHHVGLKGILLDSTESNTSRHSLLQSSPSSSFSSTARRKSTSTTTTAAMTRLSRNQEMLLALLAQSSQASSINPSHLSATRRSSTTTTTAASLEPPPSPPSVELLDGVFAHPLNNVAGRDSIRSSLLHNDNDVNIIENNKNINNGIETGQDEEEEEETNFTSLSIWKRMPNTAFGVAMGLIGQAIMWSSAGKPLFNNEFVVQGIATSFWLASILVTSIVGMAYLYKVIFLFPLVEDELKDGERVHFFNMPHLIMIMLAMSVPKAFVIDGIVNVASKMLVWTVGFIFQLVIASNIYERWLFSQDHINDISCARPQFLLSTMGFFLLASLGASAELETAWGVALPSFCFGVGIIFYLIVVNAIFHALHTTPKAKGSPALFLLIAPPSVAVVALDNIIGGIGDDEINILSEILFGWCLGILLLLVKFGPKIAEPPPSLGAYWTYVFPLSALATAAVRIASEDTSRTTRVIAIVLVILAVFATLIVFSRMLLHAIQSMRGEVEWQDNLLTRQRIMAATQTYTLV